MTAVVIVSLVAGVVANRVSRDISTAKRKFEGIIRNKRISEELGPIQTEFVDTIGKRLADRADDIDSYELLSLSTQWDVIAAEIDDKNGICRDEAEAVDWLTDQIVQVEDVQLDSDAEQELRTILAEELGTVVDEFHDRIADNDELARQFQLELESDILGELRMMRGEFERLTGREPYDLYTFPGDRDAVLKRLLPGRQIDFVDRPEVPDEPPVDRNFVLGPSGSGKTRIIAEWMTRLHNSAIAHVLFPQDRLLDTSDAKALAAGSFDGDILLIWEDVHRVDESGENRVLESVLHELEQSLSEQGYELYTLLEAQSGQLHKVPGNLPKDFDNEKSLWSSFDPIWVGELPTSQLRQIAASLAEMYGIDLPESSTEVLVHRTADLKFAPAYLNAVLSTAEDQLTVDDVNRLPETVSKIWELQYEDIAEEIPEQWKVLAAMKYLFDISVPRYSKLVRSVYLTLLAGERGRFRRAVEKLEDERRWLSVRGDDLVAEETVYHVHDTQLKPIRVNASDDAAELSELLIERSKSRLPTGSRAPSHFFAGLSFFLSNRYELSRNQWRTALDFDSHLVEAHNNYAVLLSDQFEEHQDAAKHYERVLQIDPDHAEAHYNYANLLTNKLEEHEEAADHFEHYIELNPDDDHAHFNYANLLTNELDAHEEAADQYDQALEIDANDAEVHNNYAVLLSEELENHSEAVRHLKRAVEIEPDYPEALYNLANLLVDESDKPDDAATYYERFLDLRPENGNAHYNYALLLTNELNEHKEAATHYERALEIDPTDADAHYNYANLLTNELESYDKAETHFERTLEIEPDDVDAHKYYAVHLTNTTEKYEKAAELYENAIKLDSNNPKIHSNYAKLLLEEFDRPDDAIERLDTSVSLWIERGMIKNAVSELRLLVSFLLYRGEADAVCEYSELGLELIAQLGRDTRETELWFNTVKVQAKSDEAGLSKLYEYGLENILSTSQSRLVRTSAC
jgi:tetratricopeptide (TPR) repeat protein